MYRHERGRTFVSLPLGSHESALVVFTQAQPTLHVVRSEGGTAAYASDGGLCIQIDRSGPCRVELSDRRTRALEVQLPEPLSLHGPWTLATDPTRGVGLTTPLSIPLANLVSWREIPELRTFAGMASYTTQVRSSARS